MQASSISETVAVAQPETEAPPVEDYTGPNGISVLNEVEAGPKSIFVTCEQKIDVESIYDSTSKMHNATRFSQLPSKL